MTPLNTIIEEEEKIIELIDHETAVKWGEHSDIYIDWRDKLKVKVKNALTTALQRAAKAERAKIREGVEEVRKTGNNGEGLPFENSPEIYGNARIEAWKNGYNTALDTILSKITHNN